jgi:trk system potassium uptake protein TrkH
MLVLVMAGTMLIPASADAVAGNPDWVIFVVSAVVSAAVAGMGALASRGRSLDLGLRQAFVLTTVTWIALAAVAALPLRFAALGLSYTDAFFEAISGLTTTGSTVLVGLDGMPPGILLWRSLLQWIGGVGIIVMGMAVLPFLRVGGMQLFHTESSDRSDKILPRPGQIAGAIGGVYLGLTTVCAVLYAAAGMTVFEAINHAMTTVATGGYSTSDGSLGHWEQPAVHWIATTFMLSGGIPFLLYVRALQGRPGVLFGNSQVRVFLVFLAVAVSTLTVWLIVNAAIAPVEALRLAAFNVVSIVTTTGYATADYGLWGGFAVMAFFSLTFVGGCTGSTAGGIKMFRFEILARIVAKIIAGLQHPNRVYPLSYRKTRIPDDVITGVIAFFTFFIGSFAVLALALGFFGLDPLTALSGAATALANVGPGLGEVIGPAGNFSSLPDPAKWLLAAGMLLGRLEIFTVFVLFAPQFWRE